MMGEGDEQTPIVIIRGLSSPLSLRERVGVRVKFTNQDLRKKFLIHPKQDLYSPLLKIFKPKDT
jgi:F420-0:gamma-glutamyl ligase